MLEILYASPKALSHPKIIDATNIFKWQFVEDEIMQGVDYWTSQYVICTYKEYQEYINGPHSEYIFRRFNGKKFYILFDNDEEFHTAMKSLNPTKRYEWQWKYTNTGSSLTDKGYEVTSKGDRRFSPYFQYFEHEGKLIRGEDYYHQVIKPAKEAGTYIEGTGHQLMKSYLTKYNGLLYELAVIGLTDPFTDMFDKYGGQNKWYAEILNEYFKL